MRGARRTYTSFVRRVCRVIAVLPPCFCVVSDDLFRRFNPGFRQYFRAELLRGLSHRYRMTSEIDASGMACVAAGSRQPIIGATCSRRFTPWLRSRGSRQAAAKGLGEHRRIDATGSDQPRLITHRASQSLSSSACFSSSARMSSSMRRVVESLSASIPIICR